MGVGFLLESEARPPGREVDHDTTRKAVKADKISVLARGGGLRLRLHDAVTAPDRTPFD